MIVNNEAFGHIEIAHGGARCALKSDRSIRRAVPPGDVSRVRYVFAVPVRRVAEPRVSLKVAFGQAVRVRREQAGYSLEQLGDRAGLRPIDVAAVERGEANLPLAIIERLAAAFGARPSELIADAERRRGP